MIYWPFYFNLLSHIQLAITDGCLDYTFSHDNQPLHSRINRSKCYASIRLNVTLNPRFVLPYSPFLCLFTYLIKCKQQAMLVSVKMDHVVTRLLAMIMIMWVHAKVKVLFGRHLDVSNSVVMSQPITGLPYRHTPLFTNRTHMGDILTVISQTILGLCS